jgi:DNA-binding XRE family transcriptional regulator
MKVLNRIKEIRWQLDITLDELAKRAGVTVSAINMIENGFRIPNQITMIKISKGLGMEVTDVFILDWDEYEKTFSQL